jgi:hypothetical protein
MQFFLELLNQQLSSVTARLFDPRVQASLILLSERTLITFVKMSFNVFEELSTS